MVHVDAGPPIDVAFALGADITLTQAATPRTARPSPTTTAPAPILRDPQGARLQLRPTAHVRRSHAAGAEPAGGTFAAYSTAGFADLATPRPSASRSRPRGWGFSSTSTTATLGGPRQANQARGVGGRHAGAAREPTSRLHAKRQHPALVAAGARPDMVQIGNEITPGMHLTPGAALGRDPRRWPAARAAPRSGDSAVSRGRSRSRSCCT